MGATSESSPLPPTAAPPRGRDSVARPASRVSLATAASRVVGLVREVLFAFLVGADKAGTASAFVIAFRIPNLLRDFFAEGALSSAFIPTFARVEREQGRERALLLARHVMGTLAVVTGAIALLGIVFAPVVVTLIAWNAPPEVHELTVRFTRIMFPFLPLVALAAVAMGVLNTFRHFFVPALAPAFFNLVVIAGGIAMVLAGWRGHVVWAVTGWAVFVVAGGAAQLLAQVPLLRREGWRGPPLPDLRFRDPGVRTVARRMAPVVISLAGTNLMLVIVTALAAQNSQWPAFLQYAFRLVYLPIGMVGVALGTVLLALGSRNVADGDAPGLDDLVRRGLRLNWFLALPAAIGLLVLAEPLIRMIYQHGNFASASTPEVAGALQAYAVGIVFYAGIKAAAPLFLAHGNTRTPMLCSLAGILVTIVAAFSLVGPWGHRGLALAVALGSSTNYLCLRLFGRHVYGRGSAPPLRFMLKVLVAGGAMGVLGLLLAHGWLTGDQAATSAGVHAARTLLVVALLGTFYFLAAAVLGIEEVRWIRAHFRRSGTA